MTIKNIEVDLKTGMPKLSAQRGQQESETSKGVVWMSNVVSVRHSPWPASKVFEYLHGGEHVEIIETIGTKYYKVNFGKHQTGYVDQQFVRRLDSGI